MNKDYVEILSDIWSDLVSIRTFEEQKRSKEAMHFDISQPIKIHSHCLIVSTSILNSNFALRQLQNVGHSS
jgi:hypothetical protein